MVKCRCAALLRVFLFTLWKCSVHGWYAHELQYCAKVNAKGLALLDLRQFPRVFSVSFSHTLCCLIYAFDHTLQSHLLAQMKTRNIMHWKLSTILSLTTMRYYVKLQHVGHLFYIAMIPYFSIIYDFFILEFTNEHNPVNAIIDNNELLWNLQHSD